MRRIANIIFGLAIVIVFGVLLPLNHDKIPIKWWSGWQTQTPLSILLLFTFAAGMLYASAVIIINHLLRVIERADHGWRPGALRKALNLKRRGDALSKQGRFSEAESLYRNAIKAYPRSAEVYEAIAALLIRQDRLEEGIKELGKALAFDPENPELLIKLAEHSLAADDALTAIKSLKKAIEIDPENMRAAKLLPEACARDSRWEDAVAAQKQVVFKRDDDGKALEQQILFGFQTEFARRFAGANPAKALKILSEILKQDRGFIPAAVIAASIHVEKEKHEDAFKVLADTFNVRPEPFIFRKLAGLQVKNALERAEQLAETVLRDNPRYHALRIETARVNVERNLSNEALEQIGKISGRSSVPELILKASAMLKLINTEDAKEAIEDAVKAIALDYECSKCSWRNTGWLSRCEKCGTFNSMTANERMKDEG